MAKCVKGILGPLGLHQIDRNAGAARTRAASLSGEPWNSLLVQAIGGVPTTCQPCHGRGHGRGHGPAPISINDRVSSGDFNCPASCNRPLARAFVATPDKCDLSPFVRPDVMARSQLACA